MNLPLDDRESATIRTALVYASGFGFLSFRQRRIAQRLLDRMDAIEYQPLDADEARLVQRK